MDENQWADDFFAVLNWGSMSRAAHSHLDGTRVLALSISEATSVEYPTVP